MQRQGRPSLHLAADCGKEAPGALFNIDLVLRDKLMDAAHSVSDADAALTLVAGLLDTAGSPGSVVATGVTERYEPRPAQRYQACKAAAELLADAQSDCAAALKALRHLSVAVEFAAEVTAAHLGIHGVGGSGVAGAPHDAVEE